MNDLRHLTRSVDAGIGGCSCADALCRVHSTKVEYLSHLDQLGRISPTVNCHSQKILVSCVIIKVRLNYTKPS